MKFTNDITFNKLPRSNDILKITYSGNLFKNNSSEVYIVYGFGENWDNTTEQKMEKRNYGFVANIQIQDSNTFNFCFKNSNQIWDNNNSFNYISNIFSKPLNSEVQSLANKEAEKVCTNSLDDILNSIDLELETSKIQNIEISEDLNVLDTLIQELFEEYNAKIENNIETVTTTEPSSLSKEKTEINLDKVFDENIENEELSNIEYFSELSSLFDEIIQNIESKNQSEKLDLGNELNKLFDTTFTENFSATQDSAETYIPEPENSDYLLNSEELNNTFSDIVKNISEVENKTNTEVNNLNYDYSDFNAMFAFAQNLEISEKKEFENIFDFSNKEFDFTMNNVSEKNVEQNISDFSKNNIENQSAESIDNNSVPQDNYFNNFSDSFYDDEDITTHENYSSLEEIVNNVSTELDEEITKAKLFENDEFQKQNEEFENAISEYAQYFDNLIEEIVSTPTSTLSTPVSTAQVLESENTALAITENSIQEPTTSITSSSTDSSSDSVPNEYALYDYSSHSFFYMFKRRIKMIFSTLFTKLPKIFGMQKDNENN